VPPLWEGTPHDAVVGVSTDDAMAMARRLAREEGIFAGTSTGANVIAALAEAARLGPGDRVVTLAIDGGSKYLSTPLYRIA
jgi:cysteine synthase A